MEKENLRSFGVAVCTLFVFVVWTALVRFVDVQPIGPLGSSVGFATVNRLFHNITGVNMSLYTVTDWLGLIPLGVATGFAILGLVQLLRRKHILKVDYDVLVLGGFYLAVAAVYILFEVLHINYRPVLINGYLEASYPSSTTMLVMCIMPTAAMQLNSRIKNNFLRRCIVFVITAFILFMVTGRLISGVHWVTDIIGGALLSVGLVLMYRAVAGLKVGRITINRV